MENFCESGIIASRKENFGFIRRNSSTLDIFFHVSEILEGDKNDYKPGTCVEYVVSKDVTSGRMLAKQLKLAPPGSVSQFEVSKNYLIGHVVKIDSSSGSSMLVRYVDGNKPKLLCCADGSLLKPGAFVHFRVQTDIKAEKTSLISGAKPHTYQKATEFIIIEDTDILPKREALEVAILKLVQDYKEEIQNFKSL
mmetsp:Transcript_1789/g.2581  ORF Transcript_1789/g.2581 Transcript_1789/m.2581 type:complete len:195 (-) Transcript_1789:369-953(-)